MWEVFPSSDTLTTIPRWCHTTLTAVHFTFWRCARQGGWNSVIFEVLFNPDHSIILWLRFDDSKLAIRTLKQPQRPPCCGHLPGPGHGLPAGHLPQQRCPSRSASCEGRRGKRTPRRAPPAILGTAPLSPGGAAPPVRPLPSRPRPPPPPPLLAQVSGETGRVCGRGRWQRPERREGGWPGAAGCACCCCLAPCWRLPLPQVRGRGVRGLWGGRAGSPGGPSAGLGAARCCPEFGGYRRFA